jgi:hypothetical protein
VPAICEFVSVKVTAVAFASAAPAIVICPHTLLRVTPVVLFVFWVIVPPASVAYAAGSSSPEHRSSSCAHHLHHE